MFINMRTSPMIQSLFSDLGLVDPFDSLYIESREPDTFEVHMAGYAQEDLKISTKDGVLLVEGENEKRGKIVRRIALRDKPLKLLASYDAGLVTIKVLYQKEDNPDFAWV